MLFGPLESLIQASLSKSFFPSATSGIEVFLRRLIDFPGFGRSDSREAT